MLLPEGEQDFNFLIVLLKYFIMNENNYLNSFPRFVQTFVKIHDGILDLLFDGFLLLLLCSAFTEKSVTAGEVIEGTAVQLTEGDWRWWREKNRSGGRSKAWRSKTRWWSCNSYLKENIYNVDSKVTCGGGGAHATPTQGAGGARKI